MGRSALHIGLVLFLVGCVLFLGLTLLERHLMVPLDTDARKIVANSAKRVSVMTAISPFVFLDMMLVAAENFRMLRRLMTLYGGRPGRRETRLRTVIERKITPDSTHVSHRINRRVDFVYITDEVGSGGIES